MDKESVTSPVSDEELVEKWYNVIVSYKRHKTLHIDEIVRQFLLEADCLIDALEMHFLILKYGPGNAKKLLNISQMT